MASTRVHSGPRSLRSLSFRDHRVAIASWGLGVGLVTYWFGTLYQETISGPGGAKAFAALTQPTADAMRAIVGPASRLDTYGGYFTYHNMGYVALFLCMYGAVQGARALRKDEERGLAEMWLAEGIPRWRVARDRFIGFLGAALAIGVLLATGIGAGTVAAGEADWGGSFAAVGEAMLGCVFAYAVGLTASAFFPTARSAAGVCGLAMVGLYVLNNVAGQAGPVGALRWLTPFAYVEQSRALVPGVGVNWLATLAMPAFIAVLMLLGTLAYTRRDSGGSLVGGKENGRRQPVTHVELGKPGLRDLWIASLREQRLGLLGWAGSAFALQWLYVAIGTSVLDKWADNPLVTKMFLGRGGATLQERYISFTVVMTVAIAAAFVIWETARWLRDQRDGRIEMALGQGVTRSRIVLERAAGVVAGTFLIGFGGMAGIVIGGWSSGMALSPGGLFRTLSATMLLCIAAGGVALLAVALIRHTAAVALLTLWLAGSWIMTLLGPMANFPDWLLRLSIFDAFGDPYVSPLRGVSVLYMTVLAVGGTVVALVLTARRRDAVY